jgi:outer membrane autotransporter protein
LIKKTMIKPLMLAAAASIAAPAAFAGGLYVNTEANSSYSGSNYTNTTTDLHVGYEGGNEGFGYYVQGGPAIVAADGVDSDWRFSGKVGANVDATEKLNFYGEVSLLTADSDTSDDSSWGTKLGAKYKF